MSSFTPTFVLARSYDRLKDLIEELARRVRREDKYHADQVLRLSVGVFDLVQRVRVIQRERERYWKSCETRPSIMQLWTQVYQEEYETLLQIGRICISENTLEGKRMVTLRVVTIPDGRMFLCYAEREVLDGVDALAYCNDPIRFRIPRVQMIRPFEACTPAEKAKVERILDCQSTYA